MKFEDNNYFIISKERYEDIYEYDKKEIYLYHFIYIKYIEDNKIKYVKIDDIKNLKSIEDKKILAKYYVKKIHYYNDCSNDNFEYGEPHYIYNIGYFFIGGFIKNKEEETKKIKELFENYNDKYESIKFPFTDIEYLSLNK